MNEFTVHPEPPFGLGNKLLRVLWSITWLIAARWTPRPLHFWRTFILRCFGAQIGHSVRVYPSVRIWAPWNLSIGDQSIVGGDAILYSQGKIVIGAHVVISQGSHLCAGTHDFEKPGFKLMTAPITIGNHAWVAAEAFVHPGVKVGEGAVVGARSVVVSDLKAWTIYSGFPARSLRERKSHLL
jgi:putative colanic acid biosynthesis acetyltransferase WcaF